MAIPRPAVHVLLVGLALLPPAACAPPRKPPPTYEYGYLSPDLFYVRMEGSPAITRADLESAFHGSAGQIAARDGCRAYRVISVEYSSRSSFFTARPPAPNATGVVECVR